ncbi:MAG: hypothetical protein OSA98_23955, partial [Rubripirellula sp.]|nr:hypothetical protein [Rubripirellula sp.]
MSFRPLNSRSSSDLLRLQTPRGFVGSLTQVHKSLKNQATLILALFVSLGLLCLFAMQASGQDEARVPGPGQYASVPMHQALATDDAVKRVIAGAKSFCAGGNSNPSLAKGYFGFYVPAKMTGPDALKDLTPLMKEVNSLLIRAIRARDKSVGTTVTDALLVSMKALAKGNYNTPARINAALMLGRLDSRPANASLRQPPVPHLEALPALIELYSDENNTDGLRVAALMGLHRQVTLGFPQIPAASKTNLQSMMTALLDSDAPPQRKRKVHAYLQRYAVDILDRLGSDEDKDLGVKLISISTAPTKPKLIALYSASKIGSMGEALKGQVAEPEIILKSWARLAHSSFKSELERLEGLDRLQPDGKQPANPADILKPKLPEDPKNRPPGSLGDEMEDNEMGGEMGEEMGGMEMGGMEGYEDDELDSDDDIMGNMFGMSSTTEANPQPPEVLASRRLLNTVLQQLQLGATGSRESGMPKTSGGLLVSVAEDKRQVVTDWVNEMNVVITALNEESLDDRKKYVGGLEEQVLVLAELAAIDAVAEEAKGAVAVSAPKPNFSIEEDELDAPADPAPADPAPADPAPADPAPADPAPADPAPADPAPADPA